MAATFAAARLTEAHRLSQARLGAQTVAAMRATWRLLDSVDLDASLARWLSVTVPVLQAQRATSARLAASYLDVFRRLEVGTTVPAVLGDALITEAVITSLVVTGPVSVKAAITRGLPLLDAMGIGEAKSARAGMRHALDGGRDTVLNTVRRDKEALGWARATSGNPCAFCAMLASRGFVYKSQSAAAFEPHDGCHCSAEPTYRRDAMLPPGSDRFAEMWQQAKQTAAAEGIEVVTAFRRAIEGR